MLTSMERVIARDVASGLTNPAIARKRMLSLSTVKTHLHNIFIKLGFYGSQKRGYDSRVLLANYINKGQ